MMMEIYDLKKRKFALALILQIDAAYAGREINFFSDYKSHLAPKFFKVVANSKKVGRHFQRQTKSFFTLSAF